MVEPELVEKLHTEFLKIIIKVLQEGIMELEQAQIVTEKFLALIPFESHMDMDNKLQGFIKDHPEFKTVYIVFMHHEEEKRTNDLLRRMRVLISENKIEDALQLANN